MATALFRVPAFLTAAGVYDWAEEGNVDRLPIDKLPSVPSDCDPLHLRRSIAPARHVLHEHGGDQRIDAGYPAGLPRPRPTWTVFDIHDVVTTPANIQGADRFIFSDESVAGDPMRYMCGLTVSGAVCA